MNKALKGIAIACVMLVAASIQARSGREALTYMEKISKPTEKIPIDMWDYIRSAAHSKNAVQVENKRRSLIQNVAAVRAATARQPGFDGDTTFRDSLVHYLTTLHIILTEDYGKIVDMEEVAEQSYDAMEAYLLAKEKANVKMNEAAEAFRKAEEEYASKHNIKLIYTESEVSKNLKKAGEVMAHYNQVYLIFFKSYKQELYLLDALNKQDMGKFEQNRLALAKTTDKGLDLLDDIDDYNGDDSLLEACEEYLEFANKEAEEHLKIVSEFQSKQEQFEDIKGAFEAKKQSERTQKDVDLYNAKVKEVNDASQRYNNMMNQLNQNRSRLIDFWNKSGTRFFERHVPK